MRFLVDAQLPRILAEEFRKEGYYAIHTRDLPGENHTSDAEISKIADLEDMIVVSKDNDFVISHLLHNKPIKILIVSSERLKISIVQFNAFCCQFQQYFMSSFLHQFTCKV